MELYNCESNKELELKDIELDLLTNEELQNVADNIFIMFNDIELQDEIIVINALHQIVTEQNKRIKEYQRIAKKYVI